MGKVDNNKQDKMNRLIETALELFTTQGINKTSISDVTSEAGVAKGTFYLYFKDKFDLERHIITRECSRLFGHAIDTLNTYPAGTSFVDKILIISDDIIEQLQHNILLFRFIDKNLSWGIFHDTVITESNNGKINYISYFQSLIDSSEYIFTEPLLMVYTIIELVGSTSYSIILDANPTVYEQYRPFLHKHIASIIQNHIIGNKF